MIDQHRLSPAFGRFLAQLHGSGRDKLDGFDHGYFDPLTLTERDEARRLLRTGASDGDAIKGHHRYNAFGHPQLADDPSNIYPATTDERWRRWHGGSFQNGKFGTPSDLSFPE